MKNVQNIIKRIVQCVLLAIGTMIMLITLNNLLRPAYIKLLNEDIQLNIVATAEKNEDALANNIRITHVSVNGKDVDLSEVSIDPESEWEYDSKNDFLYAYNLESESKITIHLKNVHTLSVTLVQEEGSGQAELWIGDKLWENLDLYKNVSWEEVTYSSNTSFMVFIEQSIPLLIGMFSILFLVWLIGLNFKRIRIYKDKLTRGAIKIILAWHLAIINVCFATIIQYGDMSSAVQYISAQPQLFLKCIVLIFLCIFIFVFLTDGLWIGFLVTACLCITLPIISNVKLINRGVPLLPWDFNMATEALSVADSYDISLKVVDLACIIIAIGLTLVLFFVFRKREKPRARVKVLSIPMVIFVLVFVNTSFISSEIEGNNTDYRVYQLDAYYSQRGFIPAFLEYCSYLNVSNKPEYYSKSTMEGIVEDIRANCDGNRGNHTPNIIAIMDESFWDAERLDTVSFIDELLPNYESLKAESIYGNLFTHVLSGGTVTSEFEFLTGFSGEFFPEDYMVYGNFLDDDFPSVISVLEEQGYRTTAIHPYLATNYNRENAYQKLGFDDCFFDEDFENAKMIRGYISDESAFEKIEEEFEKNKASDQPQFIFTVTMQNHGGYWEEQTYSDSVVRYTTNHYSEVAEACMTDYFSGLHESDRALGELIDYFRNVDEDTIIVFFGDHMSDAGPKDDRMFAKTEWKNNTYMYDYETHVVPFLVWSNFDSRSENWGIMEVGELLPSVFDTYGIACSDFWNFLIEIKKYYAAIDQRIVVNSDGAYTKLSELTEEQTNVHEIYRLLQYDCIWGENYASDLWSVHEQ